MHARKTMIQGSPEQVEQARQVIESHVIPKAKEMRGFRGGYWLTDRKAGGTLSFTFFDTKDDLEASEEAAAQLRSSGVAQIQGASVAGVSTYEVGLSTGEKVHDRASHARSVFRVGRVADEIQRDAGHARNGGDEGVDAFRWCPVRNA